MSQLSPDAEAIWEAFNEAGVFLDYGEALAAAFLTLADQVVPLSRDRIRAIAAELEGRE